ncbi:MAG: NADH-quinone oxidoreductase subunit L [Phycisphaeraceae bacterium]|nr:MAG: NADH-quinone oxidoreductase subunit L [Phycisphaeraceae bacterium]
MTTTTDILTLAAAGGIEPGAGLTMLVPVLTLLGTLLCGLCAAFKVKSKLPAWLSVACLAGSFVAIAATYADLGHQQRLAHGFEWINFSYTGTDGQPVTFKANFAFYIDSLTLLWMLFVTGLATLIALYASEYMSHDQGTGYCRFFAAFNLFVFSMACLVMGDNLLLLYLGWEGVGLCSYLLIGYFYTRPSAVAAAKKAFIMNRIGDLGLALGIMLTFVHFGSVEYAVIFEKARPYIDALKAGHLDEIPLVASFIPILLMIGAFGKSAQLPLYVWLPDAMEGPTPVSALIHAATMVTAGVYLIARTYPLFLLSDVALPIVGWVGASTALLAATIGMAQFDIKRIMAYSTVSQLGYMFAGLAVLSPVGGASHVFTHAFFKAMLFLSCGAVMHGFAGQLDLRKLSGLFRMPGWKVVSVAMLVGCLNLAGFPLITAGYWSKDIILAEAFVNMPGVGWVLLITAGLTAYYTFRVFFRVFMGPTHYEPGDEVHGHDAHGHGDAHGHDHGHAHHDDPHGHGPAVTATAHDPHAGHDFHPHAPGWAINTVLAVLALASFAIVPLMLTGEHHGWAGGMVEHSSAAYHTVGTSGYLEAAHGHGPHDHGHTHGHDHDHDHGQAHGTFLGMDPHKVMYYVSGVVGLLGIAAAFWLHLAGRTSAASSRADALVPAMGPLAGWARGKWFVDEFYDALIVKPLWVISHIFHVIDTLIVDGLVNLVGWVPRALGGVLRPSQSGQLHGYAAGMAGGLALLLIIVLWVTLR